MTKILATNDLYTSWNFLLSYERFKLALLERIHACAVDLKKFYILHPLDSYYWYLVWRFIDIHENIFLLPQKLIDFGLKASIIGYYAISCNIILVGSFLALIGQKQLESVTTTSSLLPGSIFGANTSFFEPMRTHISLLTPNQNVFSNSQLGKSVPWRRLYPISDQKRAFSNWSVVRTSSLLF